MRLCLIGTGYVGLVSAACFAEMGNDVLCVDSNPAIVSSLSSGKVHIYEPGLEDLVRRNHAEGRLAFTSSLEEGLRDAELAFICVGTPPKPDGSCDLSYVETVARDIGRLMPERHDSPLIVVDKSTVPVGTADIVQAIIDVEREKRGLARPAIVVSNPEFLKEGDAVSDFMKPDRVIVGTNDHRAAEALQLLYSPFARNRDKIILMGVRSAEMTKYAANCMLATKISFINEIANLCEKVGANVRDVRTGIGSDHRIGYHFIYPGLGYGGSCFPKDVKALIRTARDNDFVPRLLESVEEVNAGQKVRMAKRLEEYFNRPEMGGLSGKTIAMWGLAFKANTDDIRESASIDMINYLTGRGAQVRAYDPAASDNAAEALKGNPSVRFMTGQYQALEGADALLVATEWNQFRTPDFSRIKKMLKTPVVFDGRNLYSASALSSYGITYFSVGMGAA